MQTGTIIFAPACRFWITNSRSATITFKFGCDRLLAAIRVYLRVNSVMCFCPICIQGLPRRCLQLQIGGKRLLFLWPTVQPIRVALLIANGSPLCRLSVSRQNCVQSRRWIEFLSDVSKTLPWTWPKSATDQQPLVFPTFVVALVVSRNVTETLIVSIQQASSQTG